MDVLGDRCKSFESRYEQTAMPGLPLLARLDGRAFHTFTRGLKRPYDAGMSCSMIETTRFLVDKLHARVGYTQSDEITLAWSSSAIPSPYPFNGRLQKLSSVLAGMASARFCQLVVEHLPSKARETPHFDCRVWQVPSLQDAADVFVWREDDATKNSITMAASAHYSHAELHGKHSGDKHELLHAKGVNWNDYPAFFKRGSYLQRRTYELELTEDERQRIPHPHRPPADARFTRHKIVELNLPPARQVQNLIEVLFDHAEAKHG